MERKYLYLGKNILVNEKGEIKDFLNLGIYDISIEGHLTLSKRDSLYLRKDFSRFSYHNFFEALSDGFKYISSFNNSVILNITKEWSRENISEPFKRAEKKEFQPILQLRFYRENNIIKLGDVLRYDIKRKELMVNTTDYYKNKIKECLPKRFSRKECSLKGTSFNLCNLYPEDKKELKSRLLESLNKVSSIINFENIENFSVTFEDTRKKRNCQFRNSGGYYVANKRLISLNSRGDFFLESTLHHELAHHIDYSLQRKYGSSFMKSIKKRLFGYLMEEVTLPHIKDSRKSNEKLSDYLLTYEEVFARLIAEYINVKLNSSKDSYVEYSSSNIYSKEEINSFLVSNPYLNYDEHMVNEFRFTIEEVTKCEPIIKRILNL